MSIYYRNGRNWFGWGRNQRRRGRRNYDDQNTFERAQRSTDPDAKPLPTRMFLEFCAEVFLDRGWVPSRTKVDEWDEYGRVNEDATWRAARTLTEAQLNGVEGVGVSAAAVELADCAMRMYLMVGDDPLRAMLDEVAGEVNNTESFDGKLRKVLEKEMLDPQDQPLAAYAVVGCKRDQEKRERAAADSHSQYVGKVGERIEFTALHLTFQKFLPNSAFSSTLYKFQDAEGNVVVWFGSAFLEGEWFEGRATVKAHEEYQGIKQTIITRAKFEKVTHCPMCHGSYEPGDPNPCTCVGLGDAPDFMLDEFDITL